MKWTSIGSSKVLRLQFLGNLVTQGLSVVLNLVFLKLAIARFPAEAYGTSVLWIGIYNLMRAMAFQPLLQFFLFHYWDFAAVKDRLEVERQLRRFLLMAGGIAFLACVAWAVAYGRRDLNLVLYAFVITAWGIAESFVSLRLNHIHLAKQHIRFGLWTSAPALVRILWLLVLYRLFGAKVWVILAAWGLTSLLCLALLRLESHAPSLRGSQGKPAPFKFRAYLGFILPICAIGLTTWVISLSDRYFIAMMLGVVPAAYYASIYGLASMPFIILGQAAVLVARPGMQQQFSVGDHQGYQRNRKKLLLLLGAMAAATSLLLWNVSTFAVRLLLRPEYAEGLKALPGVLAGQIFMTIGQGIEMDLYIKKRSDFVLYKQIAAAATALLTIPLLINHLNLLGAGLACAVYYGVDLILGFTLINFGIRKVSAELE